MDTDVTFISHASVLIRNGDNFILTDPWYSRPAFGTWLPSPAPCASHPYLPAMAETYREKFFILISHGHDDHLDDDFLSLFPSETKIIISKFPSPGTKKRLERLGFEDIIEVDSSGLEIGKFFIRGFIDEEESLYDSFFSISSVGSVIVHQNDNWKAYKQEFLNAIISDTLKYQATGNVLFMSQCNLADGFPYCYDQYSEEEKLKIATNRKRKMVTTAFDNASRLGARWFLNYAGHAKVFTPLGKLCQPQTVDFVKMTMPHTDVRLLDMIPGDRFDFDNVTHMFSRPVDEDYLNMYTTKFYEKYGIIKSLQDAPLASQMWQFTRSRKMKRYLKLLNDYINSKLDSSNKTFRPGIIGTTVGIEEAESGKAYYVKLGHGLIKNPKKVHTHMIIQRRVLDNFLLGNINWENLYIGYQCKVRKLDKNYNNGDIMRWLAMFGYVYQKFHA